MLFWFPYSLFPTPSSAICSVFCFLPQSVMLPSSFLAFDPGSFRSQDLDSSCRSSCTTWFLLQDFLYFDLFLFCLLEQETNPSVLFLLYYLFSFSALSYASVGLPAPIVACHPGFVIQQMFANFVLSGHAFFFFLQPQPHVVAGSSLLRCLAQCISCILTIFQLQCVFLFAMYCFHLLYISVFIEKWWENILMQAPLMSMNSS